MNEPVTPSIDEETPLLLKFLQGRDSDCPACGYNLRDLREPRCPECGEPLSLRVQPTELKIGWPIAGVIGLSAGAGFSLMMVAFFLISVVPHRSPSGQDLRILFFGFAGPAAVYLIALRLWFKSWRRIRQAAPATRVRLVLRVWSLPLIHIVLFSATVR